MLGDGLDIVQHVKPELDVRVHGHMCAIDESTSVMVISVGM